MTPPKHIWSGNWRDESDAEAEARRRASVPPAQAYPEPPTVTAPPVPPQAAPVTAQHQIQPSSPPPPAGPTPPRVATSVPPPRPADRRARTLVGTALVALVAGAAGSAATIAIVGDENGSAGSGAPAALPSATGKSAVPKKGQTIANAVYEEAGPAVVSIRTATGSGTGFLIDSKGTIVTNDHVIEDGGGSSVRVKFGTEGDTISGRIRGKDPSSDLAVVVVPSSEVPKSVTPLKLADSDSVRVGDTVIAIGNPFALDRTLTSGVVSSLGRSITAPNGYQIDGAIQTDAAINPGNSGGPLLDENGNVIGVNSQIATGSQYSQGNIGIGFAVPSNVVRFVVPQLREGRQVQHAWLGVVTRVDAEGRVRIAELPSGSPAAKAGVEVGDEIVAIDGRKLTSPDEMPKAVNAKQPRQQVTLTVNRDGVTKRIQVTLGVRPNDP